MKALTLQQPWATLVAIGAKRIETRSWATKYRGPLLIHSSVAFPKMARDLLAFEPFKSVLAENGFHYPKDFPLGQVLARVWLLDCISTNGILSRPPGHEREFGDYSPDRFAWRLDDVERFAVPFPRKGMLGLWECKAR